MKTLQRNKFKGFTIIELMIVVMIVAILLAIAYPSYVQYVRKANRGEAQQLLMNWSINQEIWRSNNHLSTPLLTSWLRRTNDHYDFSIAAQVSHAYTLQATAKGDQLTTKPKMEHPATNPVCLLTLQPERR